MPLNFTHCPFRAVPHIKQTLARSYASLDTANMLGMLTCLWHASLFSRWCFHITQSASEAASFGLFIANLTRTRAFPNTTTPRLLVRGGWVCVCVMWKPCCRQTSGLEVISTAQLPPPLRVSTVMRSVSWRYEGSRDTGDTYIKTFTLTIWIWFCLWFLCVCFFLEQQFIYFFYRSGTKLIGMLLIFGLPVFAWQQMQTGHLRGSCLELTRRKQYCTRFQMCWLFKYWR